MTQGQPTRKLLHYPYSQLCEQMHVRAQGAKHAPLVLVVPSSACANRDDRENHIMQVVHQVHESLKIDVDGTPYFVYTATMIEEAFTASDPSPDTIVLLEGQKISHYHQRWLMSKAQITQLFLIITNETPAWLTSKEGGRKWLPEFRHWCEQMGGHPIPWPSSEDPAAHASPPATGGNQLTP